MASIVPQSRHDMDMAYSVESYRGGAVSSMAREDLEKQRNMMSMQEARWVGVRKKVPGMSGIPGTKQKTRSQQSPRFQSRFESGYLDMEDPYMKKINEMNTDMKEKFQQKECYRFVPAQLHLQRPKAVHMQDIKCCCGEILSEHKIMKESHGTFEKTHAFEQLVSPEFHELMARDGMDEPPKKIPEPQKPWDGKNDKVVRKLTTTSFGKINFENVEHAGGKKPAKYVRVSDDTDVVHLLELMKKHWRMMEPKQPDLVISVVGGAKNFKLDGRMRDTFSSGLIKAAKTTSAWLISSGFNMGIMKSVGQAVRQGQSFNWDNDRMVHVLRCIGIAPWGYVKDRKFLENTEERSRRNEAINYRTSNVILHDSPVPLNPDHTHFIFVDDGLRNRYGGVSGVRARLEQKISQPESEGGLGIPLVLVVVEGGTDSIHDASESLKQKIPVVVCAGTGRAADILKFAYKYTKTSGDKKMTQEQEKKLDQKILDAYGKTWKDDERAKNIGNIKKKVQECCECTDLMHIFHMNKHEDLDLAILSVLLKARKGSDEQQRLSQLKLALNWDRVDIAQEEIFREDVLWSTGTLHDVLTEALKKNKVQFVELILRQGIVMKEYLTVQVMVELYENIPSYVGKVMHRLTGKTLNETDKNKTGGKTFVDIENIRDLLFKLLDKYDTMEELLVPLDRDTEEAAVNPKLRHFQRPYKMLLTWALLLKYQEMAKLFWELGDEPITSALVATRIFQNMAKYLPKHESHLQEGFEELKKEFEGLATNVLNACHMVDPDKAMMIVERKSPCFNEMSCLQIAASANDTKFLSSPTCFSSLNMKWKHGILFTLPKMFLCIIFPPYIIFGLEILNLDVGKNDGNNGTGNWCQKIRAWVQKIAIFYSSPLSKFAHGMVAYAVFLIAHSYMVLVDFKRYEVTPLEWVMVIWVFSFFIDEIHTFIAFPSPTFWSKIRDWYGFLKWLDVINFILAFVAFIVHIASPHHFNVTKVLYCVNSIIFYLRIMKIYIAHGQLGPKMFMIRRMLDELRMFVMVMVVFLLAYGIASQGLLYKTRSPTWRILKDIIYFPYWQLFGEIFLEEIDTEDSCTAGADNCRTSHWLVYFLLAGYLMVGNILLLNLLIAIFSHVFEAVDKNSQEIWKYQMYFMVNEYEKKTALVPPASLLEHFYLAVMWVVKHTCSGKRRKDEQTWGPRHLEYLQLFEKEMMMNCLRDMKSMEMSGIDMTVHKLQKRVDELTKLIEDEVVVDTMPNHPWKQWIDELVKAAPEEGLEPDGRPQSAKLVQIAEVEEEDKEKKHKKKKKKKEKKRKREREQSEERQGKGDNLNNLNIIEAPKPEFEKQLFKKTERGLVPTLPSDDSETDNVSPLYQKQQMDRYASSQQKLSPLPSRRQAEGGVARAEPVRMPVLSDSDELSPRELRKRKKKKKKQQMRFSKTESD
ncbi:transient receptor potential cation channel subfamily M member-like 2 isoform X2 [Dreissena polymorpha]|uniref:transient receptor potential cation channel subfamily M member-like 2 isoform X2 n=1 Tax=Dreissena polymorpha TaxID=45954 RepID=UPI002264AB25|nr:transient receptor potential cation channel subfamily M member-like 2 isoform X2 [Dreissena polymorpha]